MDELKNALIDLMKFLKKYHSRIINMDYATIKQLVQMLLKNPEDFIKKLKTLLENNIFNYDGDIVSLLSKSESEITALMVANGLKQMVKKVNKEGFNLLEKEGKLLEKSIFNGETEKKSISSEVRKIADKIVSTTTGIAESIFSSLLLFGFGSNTKNEA